MLLNAFQVGHLRRNFMKRVPETLKRRSVESPIHPMYQLPTIQKVLFKPSPVSCVLKHASSEYHWHVKNTQRQSNIIFALTSCVQRHVCGSRLASSKATLWACLVQRSAVRISNCCSQSLVGDQLHLNRKACWVQSAGGVTSGNVRWRGYLREE